MILTCPECATSYFVDGLILPPKGRMVKCTSCDARWRAMPEPDPAGGEPAPADASAPPPEPDPAEAKSEARMKARAAAAAAKAAAPPAKGPPRGVLIGAVAAVVLVAAIGGLVLFRQQVVGAVPATATAFRAVGLPVNTLGLVIEGVASKPIFVAGRPALSITGAIRNVKDEAREAPALRISLLDEKGEAVAGLIAQPLNAKVPPGGRRYFAVSLAEPPRNAHKLEIAFEGGDHAVEAPAGKGGHAAPGHGESGHGEPAHGAPAHGEAHPPAAGHAPEPIEAKPLPPDSPDALHPHD